MEPEIIDLFWTALRRNRPETAIFLPDSLIAGKLSQGHVAMGARAGRDVLSASPLATYQGEGKP
jgi:hypothetical protein